MLQVCVLETAHGGCDIHSKHYPRHAFHCAFKMYLCAHQVPYPPDVRPPGFPWHLWPQGINTAACLDPVKVKSQAVSKILRGPAHGPPSGLLSTQCLGTLCPKDSLKPKHKPCRVLPPLSREQTTREACGCWVLDSAKFTVHGWGFFNSSLITGNVLA